MTREEYAASRGGSRWEKWLDASTNPPSVGMCSTPVTCMSKYSRLNAFTGGDATASRRRLDREGSLIASKIHEQRSQRKVRTLIRLEGIDRIEYSFSLHHCGGNVHPRQLRDIHISVLDGPSELR